MADTVRRLRAAGLRVKVVGDNPYYPFANPGYLAYRLQRRIDPNAPFYAEPSNDWSINSGLSRTVAPEDFFDPSKILCSAGKCLVYFRGKLIMEDNGHLSDFGAHYVVARMSDFLSR
jgi:hypothetical protein